MSGKADIARAFFAAWARQDHVAVLALLHDDVEYQNMPFPDVLRGKPAITGFMEKFGKGMSNINVKLRHVVEAGDVVFHEGVETYTRKGVNVALPYCGVFEFEDGLIRGWRDYFDRATLEAQFAPVARQTSA